MKDFISIAPKVVLDIKEVALLTGLSLSTLYKRTCKCEIPHYRQGGKLYFVRAEIEAWLTEYRIPCKGFEQQESNKERRSAL